MQEYFPPTEDEITSEFRYEAAELAIFEKSLNLFSFKDEPAPCIRFNMAWYHNPLPAGCFGIPLFQKRPHLVEGSECSPGKLEWRKFLATANWIVLYTETPDNVST